jgi:hypothetical protein
MSENNNCYIPNSQNPMGNFLPFDKRDRSAVCETSTEKKFKLLDANNDTFRNIFYTNPVTESYPDTTGLAKFLFSNPSQCRDTGYLCRTNVDQTLNLNRLEFYPLEQNYQQIKAPLEKTYKFTL